MFGGTSGTTLVAAALAAASALAAAAALKATDAIVQEGHHLSPSGRFFFFSPLFIF